MPNEPSGPSTGKGELVQVGKVVKALGLKGWVVAAPMTAGSDLLEHVDAVVVESKGVRRTVKVLDTNGEGSGTRLTLEGVKDRTAAEALVGATLWLAREDFPETSDDEAWLDDLLGLPVVDRTGAPLGTVVDLESSPMQEWLVVQAPQGHVLVPFTEPLVDVQDDRIVVDAPPGLFDPSLAVSERE